MKGLYLLPLIFIPLACGPSQQELAEYEEAKTEKEVSAERLEAAEEENLELKALIEAKERELAEAQAARDAAAEGETGGE